MGIPRAFTRRHFLLGGVGLLGFAVLDARFAEPRWLRISRHTVPLGGAAGAAPVRIVQLSDLHASPDVPLPFIAEAIDLAIAQKPDLIALTGDFVTDSQAWPAGYAAVLARLPAAAPTFACLGNHDGGVWRVGATSNPTVEPVLGLLRESNIPCLINASCGLTLRGRKFQIIGTGDLWSAMCQPAPAFAALPPRADARRVVLNHNPDAKDLFAPHDWDLMLCGHTHGGQVRLPLIGTPFAPVSDKRYVEGLHRWSGRWLHVTRGVGNLHGVRVNCRPEISVLDLV